MQTWIGSIIHSRLSKEIQPVRPLPNNTLTVDQVATVANQLFDELIVAGWLQPDQQVSWGLLCPKHPEIVDTIFIGQFFFHPTSSGFSDMNLLVESSTRPH